MEILDYNLNDGDILSLDKNNVVYNISINKNQNVKIIEHNLSNSQINLNIADDANVVYNIINLESSDTKRKINTKNNSTLKMLEVNVSKISDNTLIEVGSHSNVYVENLCVVDGYDETIDTKIEHIGEGSVSKINNIGVALNNANILFDTIGYVKKGIKGCDCRQLSKGVIVGDNSKITTKPILLIDEFDVMAYHGATIGKMSDDELFYLMSRGLSKNEAFLLILDGLINPILDKVEDDKDNIKEMINKMIKG